MTNIYDLNLGIDDEKIKICAEEIQKGNTVVFPTETVYGIGADATNFDAVRKIFEAKGRQGDNPLIVHISNMEMLDRVAINPGNIEKRLMEEFWPGPLTIILNKKECIPTNVTAGLDTVGVRMPDNEVALKLIEMSNLPIAAPSANISGRPSGTKIDDIKEELNNRVDNIIDFGDTLIGVESTVIKVVDDCIKILRPGKITSEDFLLLGFKVQLDEHIIRKYNPEDKNEKVESPGMKYRHYAPKTECIHVEGKNYEEVIEKINKNLLENASKNIYVMGYDEDKEKINTSNFIPIGSKNNLSQVAHNIFTLLRQIDNDNADYVLIEMISKKEIGLAIYNRVIRACEYKTL